eukprot:scaffold46234_cov13-Tisochrysis_lutea.AAC.1
MFRDEGSAGAPLAPLPPRSAARPAGPISIGRSRILESLLLALWVGPQPPRGGKCRGGRGRVPAGGVRWRAG